MGLETGTYIDDLVTTNPVGASDPKSQGDDHIRLLKTTVQNSFPNIDGAVTFTAAQMNDLTQAAAVETISGAWVVSGIMNFTTNFTIDGVDILTGAIPVSGAWVFSGTPNFTGNPTTDSLEIGFKEIPQQLQNGNYTCVLDDNGKHIYKASGGAGETITIPANSSVAYPLGATLTFLNQGGGDLTIAITTDTMTMSSDSTTGSRTLADDGIATAVKVTSTSWLINGTNLT